MVLTGPKPQLASGFVRNKPRRAFLSLAKLAAPPLLALLKPLRLVRVVGLRARLSTPGNYPDDQRDLVRMDARLLRTDWTDFRQ